MNVAGEDTNGDGAQDTPDETGIDLKALTEAVGADRVEVEALARGSQNPHDLDPATAPAVTAHIVEALARVAPGHRSAFEARRREFLARLEAALDRWQQMLAPFRGAQVVVSHDLWAYFLERFGLRLAATIEDRPGIPPPPAHVSTVIRKIRDERIRVVIAEPWSDRKLVGLVAREGGAQAVPLAPAVGSVKGTDSYLDPFDCNVRALVQALQ